MNGPVRRDGQGTLFAALLVQLHDVFPGPVDLGAGVDDSSRFLGEKDVDVAGGVHLGDGLVSAVVISNRFDRAPGFGLGIADSHIRRLVGDDSPGHENMALGRHRDIGAVGLDRIGSPSR